MVWNIEKIKDIKNKLDAEAEKIFQHYKRNGIPNKMKKEDYLKLILALNDPSILKYK